MQTPLSHLVLCVLEGEGTSGKVLNWTVPSLSHFPHRHNYPYEKKKNKGDANFVAEGLHMGNRIFCPWAASGDFAMQIRLPTTSISGNRMQLSGHWSGLQVGFLPCKWGCPQLHMEMVGSSVGNSVGNPLRSSMKTVDSSMGNPLNCPLTKLKCRPSLIYMQCQGKFRLHSPSYLISL